MGNDAEERLEEALKEEPVAEATPEAEPEATPAAEPERVVGIASPDTGVAAPAMIAQVPLL